MNKRLAVPVLLFVIGAPACRESDSQVTMEAERHMTTERVEGTLQSIAASSYWGPVAASSDYGAARKYIRGSDEVKLLVQWRAEAVPRILEAMRQAGATDRTRAVFAVVLELAAAREAIPVLVDYVASLPQEHGKRLGFPADPASHVLEAINALADLGELSIKRAPTRAEFSHFWARRVELLARARAAAIQPIEKGGEAERRQIDGFLDRFGTERFWADTLFHSGYSGVREVIRTSPQVEWLVRHNEHAIPRIIERLETRSSAGRKLSEADAVYAVVLELACAKEGLRPLIEHLRALPPEYSERVGLPWEPANFVIEAVNALADLQVFRPGKAPTEKQLRGFFARRSELLPRAEAAAR